jgi:hypothetical protein
MPASDDLCDLSAVELVARLRRKQVSAREVMIAHRCVRQRPEWVKDPIRFEVAVGPHRNDWSVLQIAHAFEQATQHGKKRPSRS